METDDVGVATEELAAHSVDDVIFESHLEPGREIRGIEEFRALWKRFEDDGRQVRAGVYSIAEEGDAVVVAGWIRTIDGGRLADTQTRWVFRFDDEDRILSARVERD